MVQHARRVKYANRVALMSLAAEPAVESAIGGANTVFAHPLQSVGGHVYTWREAFPA